MENKDRTQNDVRKDMFRKETVSCYHRTWELNESETSITFRCAEKWSSLEFPLIHVLDRLAIKGIEITNVEERDIAMHVYACNLFNCFGCDHRCSAETCDAELEIKGTETGRLLTESPLGDGMNEINKELIDIDRRLVEIDKKLIEKGRRMLNTSAKESLEWLTSKDKIRMTELGGEAFVPDIPPGLKNFDYAELERRMLAHGMGNGGEQITICGAKMNIVQNNYLPDDTIIILGNEQTIIRIRQLFKQEKGDE